MPKYQRNQLSGDIGTSLHRAFSPARDSAFDDMLARFDQSHDTAGDLGDKSPPKPRWSLIPRAE
jgi:hypothetical protein